MDEQRGDRVAQYIGVGCFTAFTGGASGGMIFVLLGKAVGTVRKCTPDPGTPACDWHLFALAGIIVGAITLPFLALRKLRRSRDAQQKPEGS